MRSMQWQLGVLGTISAFAFRHRETKRQNMTSCIKKETLKTAITNNGYSGELY